MRSLRPKRVLAVFFVSIFLSPGALGAQAAGQAIEMLAQRQERLQRLDARITQETRSLASLESALREAERTGQRQTAEVYRQAVSEQRAALESLRRQWEALRTEVQEARRQLCTGIRNQIAGTKAALQRLQKTIQNSNRDLEEWATESEAAATAALNVSLELLKSGVLYRLSDAIDDELDGVTDRDEKEKLQSLKRAMDQTTANIGEVSSLTDFMEHRDLERALDVLISGLDDPALQQLFRLSPSLGPLANLAKYSAQYGYQATRVGVSWARISQLTRNSEEFLRAVRELHTLMQKHVRALEENHCTDHREVLGSQSHS